MFAACELGMGILKAVNLPYPDNKLFQEAIMLVLLLFLETIRIIMGRKGSLSEHVWQVNFGGNILKIVANFKLFIKFSGFHFRHFVNSLWEWSILFFGGPTA